MLDGRLSQQTSDCGQSTTSPSEPTLITDGIASGTIRCPKCGRLVNSLLVRALRKPALRLAGSVIWSHCQTISPTWGQPHGDR